MRKNLIRTTTLAAMAAAAVLSLSACDGGTDSADAASSPGAAQESAKGQDAGGAGSGSGGSDSKDGPAATEKPNSTGDNGSGTSGGASDGGNGGGGKGVGQSCGANDLTWSAKSETQAGGYLLVSAKAKPGITCTLPAALPVVAFGSDGTEAGPAEQSVGAPVKLSGATTAYAGVNPKTTNTDGGKELTEIIVTPDRNDSNPVSLKTGSITVDKPIVTNWHTSPADAVPGDGLDSH